MNNQRDDLDELMDRKPGFQRFFGHIGFSYFFAVFWIIVLILVFQEGIYAESQLSGVPNWLILGGASILLIKNAWRIVQFHFLGNKN